MRRDTRMFDDPLQFYSRSVSAGIVVAVWLTQRRLEHRGGKAGQALDIATWAVPFGIIGGRLYHVITSPDAYFGEDGNLIDALKIWQAVEAVPTPRADAGR